MPVYIKTAVIIGAGNVAWHLGKELVNKGIKVIQVASRTVTSAKNLAIELNTEFTVSIDQINRHADIYFISVSDDALVEVIKNLKLSDQLVVHTSGSTPIDVFEGFFKNYGVIYPLQTFTKKRSISFSEIPLFIEANSPKNFQLISQFTALISEKVIETDSDTRAKIHLAAVFACNFTNHMYSIAEEILTSKKIDFSVLYPLIHETALKALDMNPQNAQTGPASRGDNNLIRKHLDLLKENPKLKNMYAILSESIQHK